MQEMVIYGVSFDMVGKQPIVLLKTVDGNKFLPIWIGHPEAASILMKLQGAGTPRPMTHDLLCDILGELDAIIQDVVATRSAVSGTVRIGMIGTTGRWLIPRLFEEVRDRHPRIRLLITEGTTNTLEPQLLQGQLDFAVLTTPINATELAVEPLFDEDLVLVLPTEHPVSLRHLRGSQPLPVEELSELELLLPLEGTALRTEIDRVLAPAGVHPRPTLELDGLRTIASLVFDGYGPAILPATAVPDHLRAQFRSLQLEGLPRRHVGIVSRRHGLPSAPIRAVREILTEIVVDIGMRRDGVHARQHAA